MKQLANKKQIKADNERQMKTDQKTSNRARTGREIANTRR